MKQIVIAVALLAVAASAQVHDHCSQFTPCQECVSQPLCGWCSLPVVYPDGSKGKQCAGFNQNGSKPFVCPGQYSTETCQVGYKCSKENFTCVQTAPGTGVSKAECEANCTNNGEVFLCNHTTKVCHVVPPGTPGSSSLGVCEASCIHPSAHPSSPSPHPNTTLYACDYSTGMCKEAPAGKGASKEVCEQQCKNDNTTKYYCDSATHQCMALPKGQPGGQSKKECDTICGPPTPKPNPPPSFRLGLYRGIEVSDNYNTGEFDLDVNKTSVTMVKIYNGATPVTITGMPFHVETSEDLIIKVTSGADSGKFIWTLSATGQPGPETNFYAFAFSAAGATSAPASIKSAWTTTGQKVYAMASCLSADCLFSLPSGQQSLLRSALGEVEQKIASFNDRCSKYSGSCEECVNAHQFCGWCSTNVTYQGGQEGTQCAGFNGPNSNSTAFVCPGHYSTEKCNIGYKCDETNYQCVQTSAGDGHPKEVCEVLCKPTPPPTPPPQMYQCNTTLKQCFKCANASCPGGLPKGPCETACIHPKHGPHANQIGIWRGLYIQLDYKRIEVEYQFTNVSLEVFHNKEWQYTANVTSFGADAQKLEIIKGKGKGYTYGATYQYESQDGEYEQMTYARGVFGGSFPSSYDEAMKSGGMEVLVLAKCQGAPCKFPQLSP